MGRELNSDTTAGRLTRLHNVIILAHNITCLLAWALLPPAEANSHRVVMHWMSCLSPQVLLAAHWLFTKLGPYPLILVSPSSISRICPTFEITVLFEAAEAKACDSRSIIAKGGLVYTCLL